MQLLCIHNAPPQQGGGFGGRQQQQQQQEDLYTLDPSITKFSSDNFATAKDGVVYLVEFYAPWWYVGTEHPNNSACFCTHCFLAPMQWSLSAAGTQVPCSGLCTARRGQGGCSEL